MIRNKTVIKDSDPWSDFAVFLGNMIAKYAEEMDFDNFPDPKRYLTYREVRDSYRIYTATRNKQIARYIDMVLSMK